jgi:hypothetical protein
MGQGFEYIGKCQHGASLSCQLVAHIVGWDIHEHYQLIHNIVEYG